MTKEKQQKNQQPKLKESDITNLIKDWAYKVHPKDITLIRNNRTFVVRGVQDAENALLQIEEEFQSHIAYSYLGITRRNMRGGAKVEKGKGTPERDLTSATSKEAKIVSGSKQKTS